MRPALALLILLGADPATAQDCPNLLHLKGYMNQAATRCGVKEATASEHVAHVCATRLGPRADRMLLDGMRFADGEAIVKGGTPAWCAFVRKTWPNLIEP